MRGKKCQILCALAISARLLFLPARCAAQESAPLTTAINLGSADLHILEAGSFKLSPDALQVARIIRVDSDIARLSELTTAKNPSSGPVTSLEELSLRQRITDAVVVATLDVDSVLDEMDYEREQTVELRSIIRARRDRAIGTTNMAVLAAGTGLGAVGGILSLSKTTSNVGNAIVETRFDPGPMASPEGKAEFIPHVSFCTTSGDKAMKFIVGLENQPEVEITPLQLYVEEGLQSVCLRHSDDASGRIGSKFGATLAGNSCPAPSCTASMGLSTWLN
jgi:hypothetical protein